MLQIRYFIYILIIIGVKHTSADEDNLERRGRQLHQFSNTQGTTEFAYNVQDESQLSSHFRKEQRDMNGVVRGSYGLKDPSGSFRLVSYIADDKGFRVHISSNEHGVGRQNPASVSLNRFPDVPSTVTDTRLPANPNRQFENKGKEKFQTGQEWPSNYDFYVPLKQVLVNSEESSKKLKPLDLGKHLYDAGFYDESAIPKENVPRPLDVYDNNSFGSKPQTDSNVQELHRNSFKSFESGDQKPWSESPEDIYSFKSTVPSSAGTRESNQFPTTFVSDSKKLLDQQHRNNQFVKKSDQLPYGILNLLYNYPQQKVHKNLPDCESVKSAVLCKPPPFYYKDSERNNFTERRPIYDNNQNANDEYRTLTAEERQKFIDSILADRLFKFAAATGKKYPPNMSLGDFTVQREYSSNLQHSKPNSPKDIPCSETNNRNRHGNVDDLDLTTSLNRPVIYNSISNTHIDSLMKYGNDWNPLQLIRSAQQPNRQIYPQNVPTQDDNVDTKTNTNSNKKLVLLTTQSGENTDQSVFELLKKLNILGFIIIPENDKESHQKLIEHIVGRTKEKTDINEKPSNISNKPIQNVTEAPVTSNTNLPNINKVDVTKFSNSSEPDISNATSKEESDQRKENHQDIPDQKLLLKNSEFLILDDVHDPESGDGDYSSQPTVTTIAPTDLPNWRKSFEDELKEEYERTVNKSQTGLAEETSQNRGIPNERVYHIQDPPTPLFDSRGNPIKSDNVPLHLHRYIAPTGITSFPWKFAIPRPAPPRSLVIPPRPSELS